MLSITSCQEVIKLYCLLSYICEILNLWLEKRAMATLSFRKKLHEFEIIPLFYVYKI